MLTSPSDLFRRWAPDLYIYYADMLTQLHSRHPELKLNHSKVFAAATINMGPRTVTLGHYDCLNLAWGMCGICVFGRFDGEKGGELRIKEFKAVVRLPSGSITYIPSALVRHENLDIQAGETRYSLTVYSAGGLFRWVHHGFRLTPHISSLPLSQQEQRLADDQMRKDTSWARFSKLTDLIQMYKLDVDIDASSSSRQ